MPLPTVTVSDMSGVPLLLRSWIFAVALGVGEVM